MTPCDTPPRPLAPSDHLLSTGLLTTCLLATALLAAQAHAQAPPRGTSAAAATTRPSLTVSVAKAQPRDWAQVIPASGAVVPWHEGVISARGSGLAVTEVLVDRGSRVRRGQVLVRFDDRGLQADVAQAGAALAQAEATTRQAVLNRERTLSLRTTGAVTGQEELQAITTAASAMAQWHQAKAALDAARVRLDHAVVTAPDGGTISSRSVSLGQVAASGMELFRLVRQDRLEWRAEVPAQQLSALRPGQAAEVTLPDGSRASGRLSLVHPGLDGTSRMAIAAVELAAGSSARPSMYVQGQLRVGSAAAIVVPAESVVLRDGRTHVFVLQGDRVRRVAVRTGRRDGAQVELTQGVAAGDLVVVRGAGFLADGDAVQVAPGDSVATPNGKPMT